MEWALPAVGAFLLLAALTALAVAGYALHLAIQTRIDVGALRNSTHNVQFVPLEAPDGLGKLDKELNEALDRGEDQAYGRIDDIHHHSEPLM